MKKNKQYEVQYMGDDTARKYRPISQPRAHIGVASDEFFAYVRTHGKTHNIRLLNLMTGKVLKKHQRPAKPKVEAATS